MRLVLSLVLLGFLLCVSGGPLTVDDKCRLSGDGSKACVYETRGYFLTLDCSAVVLKTVPRLNKFCPQPTAMVIRLKDPATKNPLHGIPTYLKKLDFTDMNSRGVISRDLFANVNLASLTDLTLRKGNQKTLPTEIFRTLKDLQTIHLEMDEALTLNEGTFTRLKYLKEFVSYNNLPCDCNLGWTKKFNIEVKNTRCSSPPAVCSKLLKDIPLAQLCDVDECLQNTPVKPVCVDNAVCHNTYGSYKCKCVAGFIGNGVTCSDINECANKQHNCSSHASCINTKGSFRCSCNHGYYGDGKICEDFDECSLGLHTCDPRTSKCRNTIGSYECACNKGSRKVGKVCQDRDECLKNFKTCKGKSMKCINTIGSFKCGCKGGYIEKGSRCLDVDECTKRSHNCSKQASCENTPGAFKCTCNLGYHGNGNVCYSNAELRFVRKNRFLNFLWTRKLIPHVLAATGVLIVVMLVTCCLCVRCVKRRVRRVRYERVPDEERIYESVNAPQKVKKRGLFRRLRKKNQPRAQRQPKNTPKNEDEYLEPLPPIPATAPPPPPPAPTVAPPPPPPPPPPVRRPPPKA